jgi:hypothetical protein
VSSISLKVKAFAGTTIEDACRDLCALADRVGILCEAGFNGVKVWAYPGTDPAKLVKAWAIQMERPEHIYRIASARPSGVVMGVQPSSDDIADALDKLAHLVGSAALREPESPIVRAAQDGMKTLRAMRASGVPGTVEALGAEIDRKLAKYDEPQTFAPELEAAADAALGRLAGTAGVKEDGRG